MGLPQSPSPPHLYPPSLQLKIYQAFIFSIPVLFSIILFLLFYLFYLKRRSHSSLSLPSSSRPPRSSTNATPLSSLDLMKLKGILKDKLPVMIFDAESRMKEPTCCVCLGEFELKEELHQLPSCQHVFHKDCICHWLHSSSTCPLCRCPVVIINSKSSHQEQQATESIIVVQDNENLNINQQLISDQRQTQPATPGSRISNFTGEQHMIPAEGSSRASISICIENRMCCAHPESVVLRIQTNES